MGEIGSTELQLMQELAQRVGTVRPDLVNGDATVGELAWVWGKDHDKLKHSWRHRMWFVDGRPAAWGWAHLPYRIPRGDGTFAQRKTAELIWQTHPDHAELMPEILDWYDEVAEGIDRSLTVQIADERARTHVAAHGYVLDARTASDDGYWVQTNERDLVDVPEPVLPEGFRFVTAEEVSVADAVQAHRDAWDRSRLTPSDFERVQSTWPYRADLHVLVQAPDQTLASTAIVWLDQTRTAEFEPVGTHRDFRRQGLGTALQLHGMHLAKAAGANRMMVACLGAPAHPAARNLYYGVGFREFTRDLPQIKVAG